MRFLVILALLLMPISARASGLTVFAAASLTEAMRDIGTLWQAAGHPAITFSFGASSTLAKQIEQGAPADIFASADEKWMDDAVQHGAIAAASRFDLVGNTLVLAERKAILKPIELVPGANIAGALGSVGRLALGDPTHVPAGIYARQALEKLGIWDTVSARLAPTDNVRAALLLLQHGETEAAIVYGTDLKNAPDIGVAGVFPANSHDPIRYPVAATVSAGAEATAFLGFLHGADAQAVLRHYGFPPP